MSTLVSPASIRVNSLKFYVCTTVLCHYECMSDEYSYRASAEYRDFDLPPPDTKRWVTRRKAVICAPRLPGWPAHPLPEHRNRAYLARNWQFEALSLQQ